MCLTQPQRGGTAIACPVIEPPSHGATAPGGPMTGPALMKWYLVICYIISPNMNVFCRTVF